MTTGLTAIYIVLMALGLLRVISKTVSYVRKQRQMESRWNDAIYDEGFKAYLDKLKEQAPGENETDSGDKSAPGGAAP
jgi:hypothetical protein